MSCSWLSIQPIRLLTYAPIATGTWSGEIGISRSLRPFADSGPAVRGPEFGRRLNGIAVLLEALLHLLEALPPQLVLMLERIFKQHPGRD